MNAFLKKYFFEILSILIIIFIPIWIFRFAPELTKIPDDFSYSADVVSFDNFFDLDKDQYGGEQRSSTRFSYVTESKQGDIVTLKNIFDVRTLDGKEIFSVSRDYGVNQFSGKHVAGFGDHDRTGYLFAPRMKGLLSESPDKGSFVYWHINYDTPAFMEYRGQETLQGLSVYRYESYFSADQTDELTGALPDVGETLGVTLDVHLQLWIEPYTGFLVAYEDQTEAYYYDLASKKRLYPWNKFRNSYTDNSIAEHAFIARTLKQKYTFFTFILPGLIALTILILLLFRGFSRIIADESYSSRKRKAIVYFISFGVLLFFVILTIVAWGLLRKSIDQQTQSEFENEVNQIHEAIENRLEIYINAINSGRGLFEASNSVERDEWKNYVDSLGLQSNFPGIQGLGYSVVVQPEDLEKHIAEIRSQGFPDFTVRPEGDREVYTSIVFLEPFDVRNRQAFGFDMFQEPTRRTAMVYARDTGQASLSGKVILVQEIDEDVQAGFLIYTPFYKRGSQHSTIETRRENILGYIYSPFRMDNFMRGIFSVEQLGMDVEIYDGDHANFLDEDKMYDARPDHIFNMNDRFSTVKKLEIAGHSWTIRYSAINDFRFDFFRKSAPSIILVGGIILSILLFFVMYMLNTRRERAMLLADKITDDLRKRTKENETINQQLESLNQNLKEKSVELQEKVKEVEEVNKHLIGREMRMIELKNELEEYKKNNPSS